MQQIDTHPIQAGINRLGPVAAANLRAPAVDPFEAFVAPGDVFRHPSEVLTYPGLSSAEKRAVLASWASDARAVESCPNLRCLPGCRAEPVPVDEILEALQALDEDSPIPAAPRRPLFPAAFTSRWGGGEVTPSSALN
ncbi:hypothetical protein SAMN05216360_107279 [Methylobacterium phyllostachyos]|uniref:Uncharacterized protein n=1 Tax=Methylobacterium phyllostachyos TaxID=582672 RepID=A0A1H0ANT5_9HYPH|nr:hypothetical protein [Methylobacterium phyllostachyos]SDN35051.1 hypothetical protein SAMN05216360_107279 [Methylobacterium phyllostachyos]